MSPSELAAWAQFAAGLLTFGAAVWAVRAAYRAPALAAEFAEELRSRSAKAQQAEAVKLAVFASLMQHRRNFSIPTAVQAINMVEVAFYDSPKVRAAYKYFIDGTWKAGADLNERYAALLEKIASEVGFGELSFEDISRSYYPNILAKQDFLQAQGINSQFDALGLGNVAAAEPTPSTGPPPKE